jgi:glycosyltransferase involved in cell wall biosynthesis
MDGQEQNKSLTKGISMDRETVKEDGAALPNVLWVVIAAYNEQRRIGAVLKDLLHITKNIVVVDDGSRDATTQEVLRHPVWLLRHAANLGQGASLQTGISFAIRQGAEYILTFDADGQHDPTDIRVMLDALNSNAADYALGSRFLGGATGIPFFRKLVLRSAVLFTRILSGVSLTDAHNGIRLMTRKGAERIRITLNRMEHASEIVEQIAESGLKYVEVPVHITYTADSLAKGQKSSAAISLAIKLLIEKVVR